MRRPTSRRSLARRASASPSVRQCNGAGTARFDFPSPATQPAWPGVARASLGGTGSTSSVGLAAPCKSPGEWAVSLGARGSRGQTPPNTTYTLTNDGAHAFTPTHTQPNINLVTG